MRQPIDLLQLTQINISNPFTVPMLSVLKPDFVRQYNYSVKTTHNRGLLSSLSWDIAERCLLPCMPGLAADDGSHALLQAFHLLLVRCSPSLLSEGTLQCSHAEMSDWNFCTLVCQGNSRLQQASEAKREESRLETLQG